MEFYWSFIGKLLVYRDLLWRRRFWLVIGEGVFFLKFFLFLKVRWGVWGIIIKEVGVFWLFGFCRI